MVRNGSGTEIMMLMETEFVMLMRLRVVKMLQHVTIMRKKTDDDDSCIFVDGICETCSGETDGTGTVVDNDSDDDGVCDADEIAGCQDATACNYNVIVKLVTILVYLQLDVRHVQVRQMEQEQ